MNISKSQADSIARKANAQLGAMEDEEESENSFVYIFEFGCIAIDKLTGTVDTEIN